MDFMTEKEKAEHFVLFLMTFKYSRNPVVYMFVAGVIGVIVKFC